MADPTIDQQLTSTNASIADTQNKLSDFQSPTSYLDLLGKVASASYNSNADLVAYREAARRRLYGEQGFKPENYNQLSPSQQESVRGASRAGLLSGIQAANETEQNRGTSIDNLLKTEGGRYNDQRVSLTDSLTRLTSRRSELEQTKQQNQTESRTFFFDLVKNYPDLVGSLTPQEQDKLFKGTADKNLMDKVTVYAKKADEQNRVKTMEKNGYIIGYDPVTGKQVYKIDTGIRDAGNGGGSGVVATAQKKGYTMIHNEIGGITFLDHGKPVSPIDWEKGSGVSYFDAMSEFGTADQGDINKLATAGYTTGTRATGAMSDADKAYINAQIGAAKKAGKTNADIAAYIRSQGFSPSDFGIKEY